MSNDAEAKLEVDSYHVYSLDRCIKCLNAFNLGQNTFCTVTMKKARSVDLPGGAGLEKG